MDASAVSDHARIFGHVEQQGFFLRLNLSHGFLGGDQLDFASAPLLNRLRQIRRQHAVELIKRADDLDGAYFTAVAPVGWL